MRIPSGYTETHSRSELLCAGRCASHGCCRRSPAMHSPARGALSTFSSRRKGRPKEGSAGLAPRKLGPRCGPSGQARRPTLMPDRSVSMVPPPASPLRKGVDSWGNRRRLSYSCSCRAMFALRGRTWHTIAATQAPNGASYIHSPWGIHGRAWMNWMKMGTGCNHSGSQ